MFAFNITVSDNDKSAPPWSLEADKNGDVTFADFTRFIKQNVVRIATEVLKEEQAKGFDSDPRTRVDNRFDRPIETVHPFGKIEFFARSEVAPAIENIYLEILKRSPEGATGLYKNSNYVIFNNRLVAKNLGELKQFLSQQSERGFGSSDVIRFINVTPYARKLEYLGYRKDNKGDHGGKNLHKGRKQKLKTGKIKSAPNGAYYLAFRAARKYKAIANFIKFTFLPGGSNGISVMPQPGLRTTYSAKGKYPKSAGRPYLYPSIVMDLSSLGAINKGASLVQ